MAKRSENNSLDIRNKYAAMHDSELLSLAKNEREKLTEEGWTTLGCELRKRGLHNIDDELPESPIIYSLSTKYASALPIAFDMLEVGESFASIEGRLIEAGFTTEEVTIIVKYLPAIARQKLKAASRDKMFSGLFATGGIALSLLPYKPGSMPLFIIIAWTAIIAGVLYYLRGSFLASRFSNVLRNLTSKFNSA